MIDKKPHPSVQPWSRGPIFPAVIARVDTERDYGGGLSGMKYWVLQWELLFPGRAPQRFASYDQAVQEARDCFLEAEVQAA